MLDHEKQIHEYEKTLADLKDQSEESGVLTGDEIVKLEDKLQLLKEKVYQELTPWERVAICRHPERPRSSDFIKNICESFTEIFGDRTFRDDHAVITGFAQIDGVKCAIIAQEKGFDTDSRLYRNFGMPHPEGYRKALRMMKLAEKFNLPVVSFLDTPGAYPGLTAEERGQGWAIATNLYEMAKLKTPIVVVLIGEGCSGGALGMGIGDSLGMLEHAYYSVISPEGCASILWRDPTQTESAAKALKMHAEDLQEFEVIDAIIKEPQGGAHHDKEVVYENTKSYIMDHLKKLSGVPIDKLLADRYAKYRKIGEVTSISRTQDD